MGDDSMIQDVEEAYNKYRADMMRPYYIRRNLNSLLESIYNHFQIAGFCHVQNSSVFQTYDNFVYQINRLISEVDVFAHITKLHYKQNGGYSPAPRWFDINVTIGQMCDIVINEKTAECDPHIAIGINNTSTPAESQERLKNNPIFRQLFDHQ
jgi:hypothetical protein